LTSQTSATSQYALTSLSGTNAMTRRRRRTRTANLRAQRSNPTSGRRDRIRQRSAHGGGAFVIARRDQPSSEARRTVPPNCAAARSGLGRPANVQIRVIWAPPRTLNSAHQRPVVHAEGASGRHDVAAWRPRGKIDKHIDRPPDATSSRSFTAGPIRDRHRATPIGRITVSDRDVRGERSPSRRYVRRSMSGRGPSLARRKVIMSAGWNREAARAFRERCRGRGRCPTKGICGVPEPAAGPCARAHQRASSIGTPLAWNACVTATRPIEIQPAKSRLWTA